MFAADRAVRIFAQLDEIKAHVQRIVQQQPPDEIIPYAKNQLDGLGRLDGSNRTRKNTQNSTFSAAWDEAGRRWLRKQAPIARPFLCVENAGLALKPEDAPVHIRLAKQHTGVIDQVASREIIRAIHDHIVRGK